MKTYYLSLLAALILFTGAARAAPAPITVKPADAAVIKSAVAAQKGHVVVVNFWATWCVPCVAEFPDFVKFSRQYKSRGVITMAVSADRKSDITAKVIPFLRKQHATFPAFLEQASDPEDFIDALDPSWQGDLPRTLIYDKTGHLVKSLEGQQTEAKFEAAVAPLLKG